MPTITLANVHVLIRAALRTHLLTCSAVTSNDMVAFEGRDFERPDDGVWVRESFKPQTSDLQTIGPNGRIRHTGLYLIDCFRVANPKSTIAKPTVDIDTMAGTVMETFTPNRQLTYSGLTVTIRSAYRSGLIVSADLVQAPVTVSWYGDSFNSI